MYENSSKESINKIQNNPLVPPQANLTNTFKEDFQQDIDIDYNNNDLLLSKIFKISEKNNEINPIINKKSSTYFKKLISEIPSFEEKEKLYLFILNKIQFFNKLKEIIDNSYELLYIIFDYLSFYDLSPFNYFIELYIKYIFLLNNNNDSEDEQNNKNKTFILKKIGDILSWFISCGLLRKINIDFLFQKIAEFQLNKELTIKLFTDLLPLIEIIYGNNCDYLLVNDFPAKKYIYLYDKENSKITTNITQNNPINIKKGFTLLMLFYLNNHENNHQCTLCQIELDNNEKIEFVLNERFDIDIKYNTYTILKEKDNKIFNIKQKKWTQLKIQINDNDIKLYLIQKNDEVKITENETKIYLITKKKKLNKGDNKNYIDFQNSNMIINSLQFYAGFVGITSYIIFFNSTNNKNIDSLQLDPNIKIRELLKNENVLPEICFIFDPNFYLYENNKFVNSQNNIIGEFGYNLTNMEQLNLNSVLKFHNYTKNIYYLGGCKNILPLFEILYKFSTNYNLKESDLIALNFDLRKLIKLIEIIFINKRKNCSEVCKYETFFFESLKLFLEKINEKFYKIKNEDSIINSFINIGNYFLSLVSNNDLNENEIYYLFYNIFFNPKIIIKFSPESQKKLINYFIEIQKNNINLLMTIENIIELLLFISKKFYREYDLKILFDYIKILFENKNTTDNDRGFLFLFSSDENIPDEIFINIIQLFCSYFKIKNDNDELKNDKEISIKNILSNNFFIENLLYFFSNKNFQIKKAILNLVFILTQEYSIILDEYFNQIIKNNQRNKNDEIKERITKEEFFNFIKGNIIPQLTNIQENNKNNSQIKRNNSNVNRPIKFSALNNYTKKNDPNNTKKTNKKNNEYDSIYNFYHKESITNFNRKRANSEKNKIKAKINSNLSKKFLEKNEKTNNSPKNNDEKNNNDYFFKFISDYFYTNINSRKTKSKSSTTLKEVLINEEYKELIYNFSLKIKNLSNHCVNFILGIETAEVCNSFLYNNKPCFIKEIDPMKYYKDSTQKSRNNNFTKSNITKKYRQKSIDNLELKQIYKIGLNEPGESEEITVQKTKCEIILTLNNWLICIVNSKENNTELINWIINLLITLIYNSKELEVIYRALFVITTFKGLCFKNQKTNEKGINKNYCQLLCYFVNNKNFIKLLEELTIYSYIGELKEEIEIGCSGNLLHKFKFINDSLFKRIFLKNSKEYFKNIYKISYELLIYSLSSKHSKYKNIIINDIVNMAIKLSGILENKKDKILFKFVNKLFLDVINLYHKEFITLKTDIERETLIEDYTGLLSIYCNYSIIYNITSCYLNNKSNSSFKLSKIIPPYLISRILYNKEEPNKESYFIFDKMVTDLKIVFSFDDIFKSLGIKINNNNFINENNKIVRYDSNTVDKLIKYLVENKSSLPIIKKKFDFLFKTYRIEKSNLELINIVSLFYNNSLYILFSEKEMKESSKINLVKLLNDFQNYIIFLLLICCNMREEEEKKQNIIYNNLVYSIKNIILRINNNSYGNYFVDSFCNIINVISKIYLLQTGNSNSLIKIFTKNTFLQNTATIKLIDYFEKLDDYFFSKKNFSIFATNFENGVSLINENKEMLFDIFSTSNTFEINEDSTENVPITFKIFDDIYNDKLNITKKIKLLINTKNLENNDKTNNYYKDLFLKINKLKKPYRANKIKNFQRQFFTTKNYKKLKKYLYSFNNSYSNLSVFYPEKVNPYPKKNKTKLLKYKISNFLSKDMTRKFLSPIIDINNYILDFRYFDYKENNIYHHSKDKIYTIDLNIFPNFNKYPLIPNNSIQNDLEKYFIIENICCIKTTHHISGIIFMEKNNNSCFYFCIKELEPYNILVLTRSDYDSMNKSCFGSLFRNNKNKKDINSYIKINFKDIIFIFNRKYCFRDNSIEIFLTNHRSYYFKFESKEKRIMFIEYILNILNKKLFKPIKSIDYNNKSIILGYYKDIGNNKDYSNINELKENWKNNKISTLEFLMWINIYGNRSFRDISQYPVFPWILNNYDFNNIEELNKNFDNIKRNFNTPIGMFALDEKGEQRREEFICSYKKAVNYLNKMGYGIEEIEDNTEDNDSNNINNNKNKENKLIKIPKYKYNIEDLFNDKDIEFEFIPYFYNSHFNNAMYVSHYLMRLFPYSLTMIEIQSNGFDSPERLFLSLKRTFYSVSCNKEDLRELIPEFFTIPELFINLNRFNFGDVNITLYEENFDEVEEINKKYKIKDNEENKINDNIKIPDEGITKERRVNVEDVLLPKWCSKNPFLFIEKYREFLEKSKININPWIDLIFGCCQRGIKAQNTGNIFPPYSYDGVIENRVSEESILKDREHNESLAGFFELGVNPTKVFSEQLKENKKIMQQIPIIEKTNRIIYIFDINKVLNNQKVKYIKNINGSFTDIFIINDEYIAYEFIIKNAINNIFLKDSFYSYNDIKINKIIEINPIFANLIIKTICNEKIIILTGFYDGSVYIINRNMKLNNKEKNYLEISNILNDKNKNLLNLFGRGLITTLEISKDEKYLIYGTNKGTIAIFYLDFFNDNNQIDLLKIIPSHIGYKINSIYISSDLNVFGDCAYDGYVHLYTLPNCKLINSIYIKNYFIDYIFLSAQPLASIILYSNINNTFKCYNINGHDLEVKQSDKDSDNTQKIENVNKYMISPIVFTDYQFNDFLLYILGNHFIVLRKMPLMESVFRINFNADVLFSMINISLCKNYIYVVEKKFNKIYIIEAKKNNQVELTSK